MLEDTLRKSTRIDYEFAGFILGRVASSPLLTAPKKRELADVVLKNLQKLYPIIASVSRFLLSLDDLSASERQHVFEKLARHLKTRSALVPDFTSVWLLHVFAEAKGWRQAGVIRQIYTAARSEAVKRYACLALAAAGGRSDVLVTRNDLERASPMLRTAILLAWRELGRDERKHWKQDGSHRGPSRKEALLVSCNSDSRNILRPDGPPTCAGRTARCSRESRRHSWSRRTALARHWSPR